MALTLVPKGSFQGVALGLPPLIAPPEFRGRMNRYTPAAKRAARDAWCARQASYGYSTTEIGNAIGIAQTAAHTSAKRGGWNPYATLTPYPHKKDT